MDRTGIYFTSLNFFVEIANIACNIFKVGAELRMFNQGRTPAFAKISIAALSVPILATSSFAQNLVENPVTDPIALKAEEAKKIVQVEKIDKNIKECQATVKSIFGSEDAKELGWSKSKEDDLLLRLSQIKLVPESEAILAEMKTEIQDWMKAVNLYSRLKELRGELDNPAENAELPDAVIRLDEQNLTNSNQQKLIAARESLDNLLENMRMFAVDVESEFILKSFTEEAKGPREEANELLKTLRDPNFSRGEGLRLTSEVTKPVWWIGGTGVGLTLLTFLYRSISQSRERTAKHFGTIKASQKARGTYGQQLQKLANSTGNPVGGYKPEFKKRR